MIHGAGWPSLNEEASMNQPSRPCLILSSYSRHWSLLHGVALNPCLALHPSVIADKLRRDQKRTGCKEPACACSATPSSRWTASTSEVPCRGFVGPACTIRPTGRRLKVRNSVEAPSPPSPCLLLHHLPLCSLHLSRKGLLIQSSLRQTGARP